MAYIMANTTQKEDPEFTLDFLGNTIPVYQQQYHENKKHHTRRYYEALKIMKKGNIEQQEIQEALNWFFDDYRQVGIHEKKSIQEIYYGARSRIIVLRMGLGKTTYRMRNVIAQKIGWYFYVTGTDLPDSKICEKIDTIRKSGIKWTLDNFSLQVASLQNPEAENKQKMTLKSIVSAPNENLFNLKIGDFDLFVDNGVFWGRAEEFFKDLSVVPDAVFLSHCHNDHMQGILGLMSKHLDTPIILSKTTLAFYLYKMTYEKRDFNQQERTLIKNSVIVKNGDSIPIIHTGSDNNECVGMLKFYFAGHMPGALMMSVEFNGKTFLYTGDYTYYSYNHIPGVESVKNVLPEKIDLMLVDGSFADTELKTPREQFGFLRRMAKVKSDYKNKVLIVGDPASVGILMYLDLHRYFIWLKEAKKYEHRPIFHLSREILDYAKILTAIPEDLHSRVATNIRRELNPFCSAMIHWIRGRRDKESTVGKLRSHKQNRAHMVIFENPNLDNRWIMDFYKSICNFKYNAVYLAGRVTNESVIELLSGEDNITLDDGNNTITVKNRATIQNRLEPDNIIVLHGDSNQLIELVNRVRPKEIAFFHTNPRNLITIRNKLERFKSIKHTHAFYKNNQKTILI